MKCWILKHNMMTRCWSPKHKMQTFERTVFNESLKVYELHLIGALSVHPLAEWKPRHITNLWAGPIIFGLIILKSTQRLGAYGGQISPRSTRRQEGLARGFGPVISQGHPFVGKGRTTGGMGRHGKEADSGPNRPSDSSAIHSVRSTFPRAVPLNIGTD
jgi:hypothetical protein